MEMHHKSLKNVLEPLIGVAGVDEIDIVGDVINGQVHQMREVFEDFFRVGHIGCGLLEELDVGWEWPIDLMADGCDAEGALLTMKSTCSVKEGVLIWQLKKTLRQCLHFNQSGNAKYSRAIQSCRHRSRLPWPPPGGQLHYGTELGVNRWHWCMELLLWR